jgi:hypothetical protein
MQLSTFVGIVVLVHCLMIIDCAKAPADLECYKCNDCASVDAKTAKVKCNQCETDKKTKKKTCVKGCVTGVDKFVFRRCQAVIEDPLVNSCNTTLCNKEAITKKVKCFKCDNCANVTANTTKIDCIGQCQKLTNTTSNRADYGCAKLKCPAMLGGKKLQCCNTNNCNSFGPLVTLKLNVTTKAAPKKNATMPTTAKPTQKAKATSYANNVQPIAFISLGFLSAVVMQLIH